VIKWSNSQPLNSPKNQN